MPKIVFSFFIISLFASSSALATKRILIIGDSLTAGYGVAKTAAFPNQLQQLLNQKNPEKYQVINAGTSGSTSASALSRMKWHLKVKPDLIILALGANDGLRGFSIDATQKNLQSAIDLAKKQQVPVILAGMKLPINYGAKYRRQFESCFSQLAKKNNVDLLPFLLKGVGGEKDLNLADGIHPNEKGHQQIAKTLFSFLKGKI